jgi:hypothetical protein
MISQADALSSWWSGSNGRASSYQALNPEFKPHKAKKMMFFHRRPFLYD